MKNVFVCAAAVLFAWASAPACADPVETTLALTLNPLTGHHEVTGSRVDRLVFAPLPLVELNVGTQHGGVRLEGLPPVTFGYNTADTGAQSTRLGILTATYRQTLGGGWFAGIGETVYNQLTTYRPVGGFTYTRAPDVVPINGSEAQYSRVTGIRLEAGRVRAWERDRIEFWAAVNPRLRGIQYTRIPTFTYRCPTGVGPVAGPGCTQIVNTYADPENGSQVDLTVRVGHRVSKHGELLYGLRYLNYTAHYDDFPGQLADRNVGFAPLIGYRIRL